MAGLLEYTKNGQVTEPPLYRFMRGNVQSFLNSIPDPSGLTKEEQLNLGLNVNPMLALSTASGNIAKGLLGNEKVLYHVTSPKNVPKILKEGIKPNAGKGFTKGQLGQTLSEKDTVYAFDNYNDALRWQTKMNWDAKDPKKASQIVPFVDDITKYTPDTHPEYNDFIGVVKKQGSVKPEQIANVEYTKPIRKMAYGEITGQYPVEELQQFKNTIPYLPEARLLSGEQTFSPYATKYNTELNPIQNFWNTQGLSQRPLNPEDYGIIIKGLLGQ